LSYSFPETFQKSWKDSFSHIPQHSFPQMRWRKSVNSQESSGPPAQYFCGSWLQNFPVLI